MEIVQDSLPYTPWADPRMRRLPGLQPLDTGEWIVVDDAYGAQMSLRDRLLEQRRDRVYAVADSAGAAASEALEMVLEALSARSDFVLHTDRVTRPDGITVPLDRDQPLLTAGRLVQEDLCLLQRPMGDEHLLTAAVLCFPASWTLAEKLMRPMGRIHRPVPEYTADLARRVQRLLEGIRPGRPIWRANVHYANTPELFTPRSEHDARAGQGGTGPYIRSERQCLLRLPRTDAVLFSIHTYMIATDSLTADQRAALAEHPIGHEAPRAAV